jgi:hypothetical protein
MVISPLETYFDSLQFGDIKVILTVNDCVDVDYTAVGYFPPGRIFWSHPYPMSHFFPDFKSGSHCSFTRSQSRIRFVISGGQLAWDDGGWTIEGLRTI